MKVMNKRFIGLALMTGLTINCSGTEADDDDSIGDPRDGGAAATDARTADAGSTPRDAGPDAGQARDAGADRDGGIANRDAGPAPRDAGVRPVACNPSFSAPDACGGDPTGTWTYRVACTDQEVFGAFRQVCPNVAFSNQIVSTGGAVTLRANGTFTRDVSTDVTADSVWPAICANAVGGCAGLQATIGMSGNTTASCTAAAGGCNCALTTTIGTFDNGDYSVNGGVITAAGHDYYFCADRGVLDYRGTPDNTSDGVFTFVMTP